MGKTFRILGTALGWEAQMQTPASVLVAASTGWLWCL